MTTSVIKNSSGERLDLGYHTGTKKSSLVILGHGLTGNKDRPLLVALAEGLSKQGWPCLRMSFSGNGKSEGDFGKSTITKEIGDLQAVLDTVPDWVRVAYIGHSMGAAVGVLTASRDLRIGALVSLAGMVRTAEFAERELGDVTPGEGNMWDEPDCPLSEEFIKDMKTIGNVLSAAARVPQPWLLIHGGADDLVPVQDGLDAHAAAVCQKKWLEIEGAGHSFEEASYPQVIDAVDDWLETHFGEK